MIADLPKRSLHRLGEIIGDRPFPRRQAHNDVRATATTTSPERPAASASSGAGQRRSLSGSDSSHTGHTPDEPSTSVWVIPATRGWFWVLAGLTTALVLGLRLVFLDTLQSEIYNDIAIIYRYIGQIQAGAWPTNFVLSAGPLYHYLVMPVIALTGLNYFGLKLASVIVSLGVLLATYALSRRLVSAFFALLAAGIAGVSSWLLIFSRLGNSQILVPLLTTGALWLAVRVVQDGRKRDVIACAVVTALGLYTYPQSFVLPGVIFATLVCMRVVGHPVRWADLALFVGVTCVCAAPFVWIVLQDLDNFTTGYVGNKIQADVNPVEVLVRNSVNALLALHVRGDAVFRSNPSRLPHLDWVSGVLFLVGVIFWLHRQRLRWSPVLLVPFVLLQVPSILVLSQPDEVPSASRTLGVAPLVYILVASGLWLIVQVFYARGWRRAGIGVAGLLLVAIVFLNGVRYFHIYISGLPYHNTPVGREIARYANSLAPDTQVYLVGQKWEAKLPEPWSVQFAMNRPENFYLLEPDALTCDAVRSLKQPAVLVWSFHDAVPAPALEVCAHWLPAQRYFSEKGLPVFHAAPVRSDLVADSPAGSVRSDREARAQ